jgi:GGDEF domain-containing protein
MKYLPRTIAALVITLAIFFNIERINFGKAEVVNLDSVVYVLAVFIVISIISIPVLRRSNVYVLGAAWIGVYLAAKVLLYTSSGRHPLLGGVYTYLTVTEVALLLITLLLAHRLASAIEDFEGAVKEVSFRQTNKRIRQLDEADDEIQLEMFRSRHYHHPLGILIVQPESGFDQAALHRAVREVQQAMMNTYVSRSMAQTFSKYIRRTDLIMEQTDQERFVILCPDTNAADLALLAEYLQVVAQEELSAPVVCGTATFPDEAITFEELMRQAETRLVHGNGNEKAEPWSGG